MEDIIKIKVDSGEAVAEIETVDSAMKKLDTTTQETTEATRVSRHKSEKLLNSFLRCQMRIREDRS